MKKEYKSENGVWTIQELETRIPNHRRGWLINNKTGNKYVWSKTGDRKVKYMRQCLPPTNIPQYIEKELLQCKE